MRFSLRHPDNFLSELLSHYQWVQWTEWGTVRLCSLLVCVCFCFGPNGFLLCAALCSKCPQRPEGAAHRNNPFPPPCSCFSCSHYLRINLRWWIVGFFSQWGFKLLIDFAPLWLRLCAEQIHPLKHWAVWLQKLEMREFIQNILILQRDEKMIPVLPLQLCHFSFVTCTCIHKCEFEIKHERKYFLNVSVFPWKKPGISSSEYNPMRLSWLWFDIYIPPIKTGLPWQSV